MLMLFSPFHIRDDGNRMTPLFSALENCRIQVQFIEIAQMLISAGADVNAVSL
jgi:hypothetical protein